jgi:hypothetical protein
LAQNDTPNFGVSFCQREKCGVRKAKTEETGSYQLGHYEMRGKSSYRRSVLKVVFPLEEYPTKEEALSACP